MNSFADGAAVKSVWPTHVDRSPRSKSKTVFMNGISAKKFYRHNRVPNWQQIATLKYTRHLLHICLLVCTRTMRLLCELLCVSLPNGDIDAALFMSITLSVRLISDLVQ